MEQQYIHVDLFSGIGGMHEGLLRAGFKFSKHYFSEIDKHAIATYKYNYPDAEYIGSVTNVSGTEIRQKHPTERILITFGWPCQDNSIAGKRKGQRKGTRSGLLFEAGRIINESQCQLFIAENVKGLYSVNGGYDFYEAIRFLTHFNTDSPQYTLEVQLLNTAWLLPQNRERIYFVGRPIGADCKRIFPVTELDIENKISPDYEYETMYTLSGSITAEFIREGQKNEGWSKEFLQQMLLRIFKKIQNGELIENKEEPEYLRPKPEGDLQEAEIFEEEKQICGRNINGEFYRVVQLPTEDMLLLWFSGTHASESERPVQSENLQINNRQNGFKDWVLRGEFSTFLLAVQSYQKRLFYSIGDGRNWQNVHIKEMGELCSIETLSHILEQDVDQSYFLSEKTIKGLLKGQATPQLLEP